MVPLADEVAERPGHVRRCGEDELRHPDHRDGELPAADEDDQQDRGGDEGQPPHQVVAVVHRRVRVLRRRGVDRNCAGLGGLREMSHSSSSSWRSSRTIVWNSVLVSVSSDRGRGQRDGGDGADAAGPRGEQHDPVGQEDGLADGVRDEDDGGPGLRVDRLQLEVHLVAGQGVQGAERLVHQQDGRVVAQRPGDRGPLPHAAGQLPRVGALEAGQADELAQLGSPRPPRLPADPPQLQRQRDVVRDRVPGEQVGVLEDEPEVLERLVVALAAAPDALPVGRHRARARGEQPGEDAQQGGLAAARAADQRDELAAGDGEVDVAEGVHLPAPRLVDLVDPGHLELGLARRSAPPGALFAPGRGTRRRVRLGRGHGVLLARGRHEPGAKSLVYQSSGFRPSGTKPAPDISL